MNKLFVVGLGGFIGAVLRYLVAGGVQALTQNVTIPYGTLTVNLTGCFLIGVFSHLMEYQAVMTAEVRLFLIVGILGSFTTYSTFSHETVNLLHDQRLFPAFLYLAAHIILGLSAVMFGRFIVIMIWR